MIEKDEKWHCIKYPSGQMCAIQMGKVCSKIDIAPKVRGWLSIFAWNHTTILVRKESVPKNHFYMTTIPPLPITADYSNSSHDEEQVVEVVTVSVHQPTNRTHPSGPISPLMPTFVRGSTEVRKLLCGTILPRKFSRKTLMCGHSVSWFFISAS